MVKKGQMKIQQTAFMIIAISIFFVLAGLVVLAITLAGLNQTSKTLEEENSMMLVSKLANSPELTCGNAFAAKTNCIDMDKAVYLSGNADYGDFWGVAKIEIRRIYPDKGNIICNADNIDNCGILEIFSKNVKTLPSSSNFVTLCMKTGEKTGIYDKCEIGLLILTPEDKTNG